MNGWLPPGKRAAVCMSIDDVHPAPEGRASLDNLRRLQERHPELKVTLFTTPDWRSIEPYAPPSFVDRIPFVRDRVWRVPVLRRGTWRLDRHPSFCDSLRDWERVEIALHGLHHCTRGPRPIVEFANASRRRCRAILDEAIAIFERARLPVVRGMAPPGWNATEPLLDAMRDLDMTFVASARDLDTPIAAGARTAGSGMRGVPLIAPMRLAQGLTHFTTNFQATSSIERATAIVDAGGLLAIKAHVLAESGTYKALDALTDSYVAHLDALFRTLDERYGDALWWTSMNEIASAWNAS